MSAILTRVCSRAGAVIFGMIVTILALASTAYASTSSPNGTSNGTLPGTSSVYSNAPIKGIPKVVVCPEVNGKNAGVNVTCCPTSYTDNAKPDGRNCPSPPPVCEHVGSTSYGNGGQCHSPPPTCQKQYGNNQCKTQKPPVCQNGYNGPVLTSYTSKCPVPVRKAHKPLPRPLPCISYQGHNSYGKCVVPPVSCNKKGYTYNKVSHSCRPCTTVPVYYTVHTVVTVHKVYTHKPKPKPKQTKCGKKGYAYSKASHSCQPCKTTPVHKPLPRPLPCISYQGHNSYGKCVVPPVSCNKKGYTYNKVSHSCRPCTTTVTAHRVYKPRPQPQPYRPYKVHKQRPQQQPCLTHKSNTSNCRVVTHGRNSGYPHQNRVQDNHIRPGHQPVPNNHGQRHGHSNSVVL